MIFAVDVMRDDSERALRGYDDDFPLALALTLTLALALTLTLA